VGHAEGMAGVGLPTGTLTFLLTDIAGSTAAWELDADAMGDAVRRHYELIDEVVGQRDGQRPAEQGEGDSTVSVFASATQAVRAAAELQERLDAEPWATEAPLCVRMAVHTGEVALRDERNYMGTTLNRCARLRSCAHGGQVLVSAATAALVDGRLGDDLRLLDLGMHRLRDLAAPEHVFQLALGALPSHFPPIASLDAALHNLPVATTTFVGRDDDVSQLAALLETERMVTLVGAGGCGKTRLALHVGAEVAHRFPDGVWLVELAPVSDPDEVVPAMASALGVLDQPGRPPLEVVRDFLAGRATMLILDNCEHLLHATAEAVGELLGRCAGLRVLATSREPLSLPGEVAWRVSSLDRADDHSEPVTSTTSAAVQLFVDRARSARPSFTLDDSNSEFVVQICRRLDGIPLAIELAAARCRTMTVERIASELDDRFRLLTGGSRTLLARQQTLLASVEWSNSLLEDPERRVLLRLAVFAGAFSLDAAEAVGACPLPSTAVFDALTRLVDKSLVTFDETIDRYRVPETIRQFAFARISPEELASARDAHCAWYVSWLSSRPYGADGDSRNRAIRSDYTDIRAAVIWAIGNRDLTLAVAESTLPLALGAVGRPGEAVVLGERCLEGLDPEDEDAWARCVIGWMMARALAGDLEHVFGVLPRALQWTGTAGEPALEAEVQAVAAMTGASDVELRQLRDRIVAEDITIQSGPGLLLISAFSVMGTPEFGPAIDMARGPMRTNDMAQFRALEAALRAIDAEVRGDCVAAERLWDRSVSLLDDLTAPVVAAPILIGACTNAARRADTATVDRLVHFTRHLRRDWGGANEVIRTVDAIQALLCHRPQPTLGYRFSVLYGMPQPMLVAMSLGDLEIADAYAAAGAVVQHGIVALERQAARAQLAHLRGDHGAAIDAYRSLLPAAGMVVPRFVTDLLACVAPLCAPEDAARAVGAADAWCAEVGFRWRFPHQQRWVDEAAASARAALGDDGFDEARSAGAAVGWQDTAALIARRKSVRTTATSGWDALTPAELETVRHLVKGLTNAQLAEATFVSVATVKTHLHHVYTKLGLSSRAALAAAATEHFTRGAAGHTQSGDPPVRNTPMSPVESHGRHWEG
jgi:predicted ATPase/class 3 adenylate cyclase/DNA-binding CsgD family transcriptional regulator